MTKFYVMENKKMVDCFEVDTEEINEVYKEYKDYEIQYFAGTYYIVK